MMMMAMHRLWNRNHTNNSNRLSSIVCIQSFFVSVTVVVVVVWSNCLISIQPQSHHPHSVVSALDWSSFGATTSSSGDIVDVNDDTDDNDEWVSPLLNREIVTTIVASDWGPTSIHTILCEMYTVLEQFGGSSSSSSSNIGDDRSDLPKQLLDYITDPIHAAKILTPVSSSSSSSVSSEPPIPVVILDALFSMNNNNNSSSSNSNSSIRLLLQYMMTMRTTSPHCELHRTLYLSSASKEPFVSSIATTNSHQSGDDSSIINNDVVTLLMYHSPTPSNSSSSNGTRNRSLRRVDISTIATTITNTLNSNDDYLSNIDTDTLLKSIFSHANNNKDGIDATKVSIQHHGMIPWEMDSTSEEELWKELALPGEFVLRSDDTNNDHDDDKDSEEQWFVIVYGLFGTNTFSKIYHTLLQQSSTRNNNNNIISSTPIKNLRFVVRHSGGSTTSSSIRASIPSSSTSKSLQKLDANSGPTILQGYGVRLDIRNVEYKVFDDRHTTTSVLSDDTSSNDDGTDVKESIVDDNGLYNVTHILVERKRDENQTLMMMIQHHHPILAGVNLTKLLLQRSTTTAISSSEILELQYQLWKIHDTQMVTSQIIPPVWQRRQLPMQMASVIASSYDPIFTFQYLIQNLPSVASTIVHVKVPETIVNASTMIEQTFSQSFQSGIVYLNGRIATSLDRPTFNVFELLKQIRDEQRQLQTIESLIASEEDGILLEKQSNATTRSAILRDIQDAWMMGRAFSRKTVVDDEKDHGNVLGSDNDDKAKAIVRIDVGRGWKKAILYLNDIEKDVQYTSWPNSLRQMLMSMQYGMPPTVRRNIYTVVCIMDPLQPLNEYVNSDLIDGGGTGTVENVGFNLALQLMQASYPARLGLLIVNERDVMNCLDWFATTTSTENGEDELCPVGPMFSSTPLPTKSSDLTTIPATTHAIHRLLVCFLMQEGMEPGAVVSFSEFLFTKILDESKDTLDPLTMHQLLVIYGTFMEMMGMGSESQGIEIGFKFLIKDESSISAHYSYGRSVRFAADKRLKPGMSFMNGRPLPTDPAAHEAISVAFNEEQNYIFGLVMKGDITDTSPKSIYAKLLSGTGVHKKYHPLLSLKPGSSGELDGNNPRDLEHNILPTNSFLNAGTGSNETFPTNADAYFVVDAYFHYHTKEGFELLKKFITAMKSLTNRIDTSSVGVMYRVLPGSMLASSSVICPILANAALIEIPKIERLLSSLSLPLADDLTKVTKLLDTIDDLSPDFRTRILNSATEVGPCSTVTVKKQQHFSIGNTIVANGHVFPIEGNSIDHDDLELLLGLEIDRATAVTSLLRKYIPFTTAVSIHLVGKVAAFLMEEDNVRGGKRSSINHSIERIATQLETKVNPLHFSWNNNDSESLQVQVAVILDPVSDAAQRFTPILKVIRDTLKLPLQLLLAPAVVLESDDKIPITSYYRFVGDPSSNTDNKPHGATFSNLPTNHLLTLQVDVPEPWNVQQTAAIQDTDNLRCDIRLGCSDDMDGTDSNVQVYEREHVTNVEFGLKNLLIFGQCYEITNGNPPNGLQLTVARSSPRSIQKEVPASVEIGLDGERIQEFATEVTTNDETIYSDTLVMKNVGYWQLPANPGVWNLGIAEGSEGAKIFEIVFGSMKNGVVVDAEVIAPQKTKTIVMKDFVSKGEVLMVRRRPGYETANLFGSDSEMITASSDDDDVIHVFSLATGHLYERFLKIMMLSVTKRTSSKVKFWLFENFLSPPFKASARAMAMRIGCEVEFVTYKWPEWLRGQSEKQRIIWGYKILFLDVLFPLSVKKIIYVDADQVVRADLKELWDMDLQGHVYGYTPFCTSRNTTLGFQFWREGFWKNHLNGKPYHISALYVVDLELFRSTLVGDVLRSIYQQLSADPNSLANLDQDLPNFAQKQVPIFSLPQEWLWCESWCSDETKATSKTIDLCNNPLHKEPKVSMAKRIISGSLFNESWVDLDAEVERYEQEFYLSSSKQ